MAKEHDNSEQERKAEKDSPEYFVVPEHQGE